KHRIAQARHGNKEVAGKAVRGFRVGGPCIARKGSTQCKSAFLSHAAKHWGWGRGIQVGNLRPGSASRLSRLFRKIPVLGQAVEKRWRGSQRKEKVGEKAEFTWSK